MITTHASYKVATNIESKIIKMSKREKTLFRYFMPMVKKKKNAEVSGENPSKLCKQLIIYWISKSKKL